MPPVSMASTKRASVRKLRPSGALGVGSELVGRNGATPMRYKVTGIPTLLVFKNGQVVEQLVGYRSKEDIQKALDKHVG